MVNRQGGGEQALEGKIQLLWRMEDMFLSQGDASHIRSRRDGDILDILESPLAGARKDLGVELSETKSTSIRSCGDPGSR